MNDLIINIDFNDIFNLDTEYNTCHSYDFLTAKECFDNLKTEEKQYNMLELLDEDYERKYKIKNNIVGKVDYVKAISGSTLYSKSIKRVKSNSITNYIFVVNYSGKVRLSDIISQYYKSINEISNNYNKTVTIAMVSQFYTISIDVTNCTINQLKQLLFSDSTIRIIMFSIIHEYATSTQYREIKENGYGKPQTKNKIKNEIEYLVKTKGLSNNKVYIGGELI